MRKTKEDLIEQVANATTVNASKKEVDKIINLFIKAIKHNLSELNDVSIYSFVDFTIKRASARKARNPHDNVEIQIPERYVLSTKISSSLKKCVKQNNES